MHIEEKKLKEFILDSGLVSRADYETAENEIKKSRLNIEKALIAKNLITDDDLRRIKAYILGIPFVDLKGQKIDFEILSMIPEPIARKNNIIAFNKKEGSLEVAMLNTDDLTAIEFVKKKVGLKILSRLTDNDSIKSAILQYQKSLKAEFGDLIQKEALSLKTLAEEGSELGE